MYILKQIDGTSQFYLQKNKSYIVGRKNADIVIMDDQSISRKHAIFRVGLNSVSLTDCGSKYGTSHNKKKLEANSEVVLRDDDVIKFGVFQSSYKFESLRIVTAGSGLKKPQKQALQRAIGAIGGSFVQNWDETCNYLTAEEMVLTVKVLHALMDNKPIVTIKYWERFNENLKAGLGPPDTKDFTPPVTETLINNLDLSEKVQRRSLFQDKTFVFTTEKIKEQMVDLIRKTGGFSTSWEKHPFAVSELAKSTKKYLFILNDDSNYVMPKDLQAVYDYLEKVGERPIPIQEIALAIVQCSSERDCNPKFNRRENVFKTSSFDTKTEAYSLAYETPADNWQINVAPKQELVIPQSLDAEDPVTATKRTQASPDQPAKRLKLENCVFGEDRPSTSTVQSTQQTNGIVEQPAEQATKRKADNLWPIAPKPKRKAGEDAENPFAAIIPKQEVEVDEGNAFLQIFQKPQLPQCSAAKQPPKRKSSEVSVLDVSASYKPSYKSNITWISTADIDEANVTRREIDPELREYIDQFKNCVVIEVLPSSYIKTSRSPVSTQTSASSGSTERKNFKKFRKVKPLRPQTTILTTSVYGENLQSDGEENNETPPKEHFKKPLVSQKVARNSVAAFEF